MSVLFAFLLAASPTATAPEAPAKKEKMKCEWVHEVGSARPRRYCVKRVSAKADATVATQPAQQGVELEAAPAAPTPATDQ
jgi:hypothetical protein